MEASEARRAVEAGAATASALGLRVDDVAVIHNSDRIALRLVPCDVLARVAPSAHRAGSEFEVEVARRLAEPMARPPVEADPADAARKAIAAAEKRWTAPSGALYDGDELPEGR